MMVIHNYTHTLDSINYSFKYAEGSLLICMYYVKYW